jgi:hypothetical protein
MKKKKKKKKKGGLPRESVSGCIKAPIKTPGFEKTMVYDG